MLFILRLPSDNVQHDLHVDLLHIFQNEEDSGNQNRKPMHRFWNDLQVDIAAWSWFQLLC